MWLMSRGKMILRWPSTAVTLPRTATNSQGLLWHQGKRHVSSTVASDDNHALGVYVHWPYCRQLCSYCDFNKYLAKSAVDHERVERNMAMDVATGLARTCYTAVGTVYLGGGTPSMARWVLSLGELADPARPNLVESVLATINQKGTLVSDAEVTMEMNPRDVTRERLQGFKAAGVTRISVVVSCLMDS